MAQLCPVTIIAACQDTRTQDSWDWLGWRCCQMLDSETLFCDNSQDGIWAPARNLTQAVTTTASIITVQWKHYLQQRYLELDIPCKNPALNDTVLAALAAVCGAGPEPMIIWRGIQNILICDTISSSQQSAGEGCCTGGRVAGVALHSALGGLV